ncbi:nitroreductase family protein [Bifidobacterium sp. ESL0690]|uniref:nitroreductase family protein n=1 Tax=Bifidobacterium sp. ESL0690 TaxID=2983214 RepID=UPI0023FA0323|nr:nitroreductase family protein [Bifidobacterium sp. ESL0690]WEV46638.1 nitroreductase family protein [Bifidobacterium sp. ESL0690]
MTESQNNLRTNETIETLLNRRSIRKFKPDTIDEQTVATLETVAQHAASSQYLQDWSAVRVEDQSLKDAIAEICNQTYVAEAPLLYLFVADEHRNAAIAKRKGVNVHSDEFTLNSSYRFTQAQNDAVLALHAMETAAYSLDLGCVILGSVLNNPRKLIELLHLPEFTYPVLGLAIGKPDQSPALKPRMERDDQFFADRYPADDAELLHGLKAFDDTVHKYYDLRNTSRPVDAFSDQIANNAVDTGVFSRSIKPVAEDQGFRFDR